MLSPRMRLHLSPAMKSRPMRKACARPSGFGCSAKLRSMPHWPPSPSRWRNRCCSCGVVITRMSRRSEEHSSELQSLMRISYAVFCLKKKNTITTTRSYHNDCYYSKSIDTQHTLTEYKQQHTANLRH